MIPHGIYYSPDGRKVGKVGVQWVPTFNSSFTLDVYNRNIMPIEDRNSIRILFNNVDPGKWAIGLNTSNDAGLNPTWSIGLNPSNTFNTWLSSDKCIMQYEWFGDGGDMNIRSDFVESWPQKLDTSFTITVKTNLCNNRVDFQLNDSNFGTNIQFNLNNAHYWFQFSPHRPDVLATATLF
jgi:hypothetical protein